MPKRNKTAPTPNKPLDKVLSKQPRGRKPSIPAFWVIGRAEIYKYRLTQVWKKLSKPLLKAHSVEQVITAFEIHGKTCASYFVPGLASDILTLIRGEDFPKRSEAQKGFLADSLGGRPRVSFRTSRDICGRERAKERAKKRHRIVRKEFYIECTCGYEGPTYQRKCPMSDPERARIENEKILSNLRTL